MHRYLLHEEHRQESEPCNPNHDLPDHVNAIREGNAHLRPERLLETTDDRYRGVRDLDAAWELRHERLWQLLLELVLQHGRRDGDAPRLREGAHEGEEGERGGCAVDWERSEDGEDRCGELCDAGELWA